MYEGNRQTIISWVYTSIRIDRFLLYWTYHTW